MNTDATPDTSTTSLTGEVTSQRRLRGDFRSVTLRDGSKLAGELADDEAARLTGLSATFFGRWNNHPKFGWQFAFEGHTISATQTRAGVTNYLSRSNLGLSRTEVNRVIKHFGVDGAIDAIRDNPLAIVGAEILPLAKAMKASERLKTLAKFEKPRIDLYNLFAGHGVTKRAVEGCIAKWGLRAPSIVRHDPFKMLVAEIEGVGFKRADEIYQSLGLPLGRLKRQLMAAWHSLLTDGDGNTWETRAKLNKAILDAVGANLFKGPQAITLGLRSRWLRQRGEWLAVGERAIDEQTVAAEAVRMTRPGGPRPVWPATIPQGDLTDHQFEKLQPLLASRLAILAGSPGTGKTFSGAALIRQALVNMPVDLVAVCAPTGKAAVRITEAMARYNLPLVATTIHSLLQGRPDGEFQFDATMQLPHRLVIVDEGSMVDTPLMAALLQSISDYATVLVIGDPYQLPPVGHGAPLRDLIAANVPTALLTKIERNAGQIVLACREIKDGKAFTATDGPLTADKASNLKLAAIDDPDAAVTTLMTVMAKCQEKGIDPVWETQIITGRNDETPVSRKVLNPMLQDLLNPKVDEIESRRNEKYRRGDKIICLKNQRLATVGLRAGGNAEVVEDYLKAEELENDGIAEAGDAATAPADFDPFAEPPVKKRPETEHRIANGDQGRVLATAPGAIVVEFQAPVRVVLIDDKPAENKHFDLGYCITVHKSQGSDWRFVIVMVDANGYGVQSRQWLYTAISRAAERCLIIGPRGVTMKMILRDQLDGRKTFLKEIIEELRATEAVVAATPATATATAPPPEIVEKKTHDPFYLSLDDEDEDMEADDDDDDADDDDMELVGRGGNDTGGLVGAGPQWDMTFTHL